MGKREFYIPREGKYKVKARITPNADLYKSKTFLYKSKTLFEEPIISFSGSGTGGKRLETKNGFKDWYRKAVNSTYKEFMTDQGLNLSVVFDGSKDEDEYLLMGRIFENIDLKKNPYLALTYQIEDPSVQTVQVVFGVKTKKEGDIERMIVANASYPRPTSTRPSVFILNAYEEAKRRFPDDNEFYLTRVEILPHKLWGVDCSTSKRKKAYRFVLHDLHLLKEEPPRFLAGDLARSYPVTEAYYYIQNNRINEARVLVKVPEGVDVIYRPEHSEGVDLQIHPTLTLRPGRPPVDSKVKVILDIDSNNDGNADFKIPLEASFIFNKEGQATLFIPALQEAKKVIPERGSYRMVGMMVYDGGNEWRYWTDTFKLNSYERRPSSWADLREDSLVLRVDNQIFRLGDSIKKAKGDRREAIGNRQGADEGGYWLEYRLTLGEGNHELSFEQNQRFKVELAMVEPVRSPRKEIKNFSRGRQKSAVESQELPKIEFKKINPTRYVVDVKDAKGPFTLIFSESFHEGWKGYVRRKTDTGCWILDARCWIGIAI